MSIPHPTTPARNPQGANVSHIINPEAVGNPDMTPIVQVDQDTADWLRDPANGGCTQCAGINWLHTATCPHTDVVERANAVQEGTTPGPWGTDGSTIALVGHAPHTLVS